MVGEIDYSALGARIRHARETNCLTQEQLGESCGLSTAHIGHIERGTRIPSLDTLYKIALRLHISIDALVFDSLPADENLPVFLNSVMKNKDKRKVRIFWTMVRAMAEKIEEI